MIYTRFKPVNIDYLIAGQGLAGTLLGYTLFKQGLKVCVADACELPSSSQVAAGIFNPVTGKRPVKTWQADLLFPFLFRFYRQMEVDLEDHFFHPKPLYRPFQSIEEQNNGLALSQTAELGAYLEGKAELTATEPFIHTPLGGLETKHSGYVAVDSLLESFRKFLIKNGSLVKENLELSELTIKPNGVEWKGISARKLIFCQGVHSVQNLFFNWLPFRQVKGEILTLLMTQAPDCIFKQGVYLVPVNKEQCKVGATYERSAENWEVTPKARQEMTSTLNQWLQTAYQVVDQQAGIRPATPDRRPFIGLHPKYPSLGIFNGLGSKGVSLAPFYSQHFYEFLECGKDLDPEVNIDRYYSLYSNKNQ
jgi:glycine/D-amino acid oxidase-like deaminating enzyme